MERKDPFSKITKLHRTLSHEEANRYLQLGLLRGIITHQDGHEYAGYILGWPKAAPAAYPKKKRPTKAIH